MTSSEYDAIYSAPGRVCLYGEHQDYLKLPVIPTAINLRTKLHVKKRSDRLNRVISVPLLIMDGFTATKKIRLANNDFDYLRAILIVLYKEKIV